jgi:hypothetical protein
MAALLALEGMIRPEYLKPHWRPWAQPAPLPEETGASAYAHSGCCACLTCCCVWLPAAVLECSKFQAYFCKFSLADPYMPALGVVAVL